jgi:hypothetical protein
VTRKKKVIAKSPASMVPEIPLRILDSLPEPDIWSGRVNESISELNFLLGKMPETYSWRFRTKDALAAEIHEIVSSDPTAKEINSVYWLDTLKSLEAFTIMSVWRTAELLTNATAAITDGRTIVAAILARSALETVAQFVEVARRVAPTVSELVRHSFVSDLIVSQELEDIILKSVFASKLPDKEDYYSPTNIMTIIARIAKSPGQERISLSYSELCEVTHPNFLGRSVYVRDLLPGARVGDEVRTLSRAHGPNAQVISVPTVWAVSWAAATQVTSANLMQSSIGTVFAKLNMVMH